MPKKIRILYLLIFLVPVIALTGLADGRHYTLSSGEKDFYFGHISYIPEEIGTKNPEIIRNGSSTPEELQLNMPVVPGDVIITHDRPCEVQFDSGTIVRLDAESRLRVEIVMAQTLSSEEKLSSLFLEKGRVYLMYKAYNSWEIFQLVTPAAALKMKNHTVLLVSQDEPGITKVAVRQGSARILFGPHEKSLNTETLKKGENAVVNLTGEIRKVPVLADLDSFLAWNEKINRDFLELHKGITPLPKPVQKLPPAVFYFAQHYGNKYGEWVWDDLYGYVWRPFYNDVYPWGNWSPYFYGRWTYVNGSLFWVPEEPWGWVPYHLGIWQWDKKLGWVWIPGSVFAPAWVDWYFYSGFLGWRPWTLNDFLYYGYYGLGPEYYYWNNYYGTELPAGSSDSGFLPGKYLSRVSKDQLKKRNSGPIPSEYKKVINTMAGAIQNGDKNILERIEIKPMTVMVKKEEICAADLKSRIITSREKFLEQKRSSWPDGREVKANQGPVSASWVAGEFLKLRREVQPGQENSRKLSSGEILAGEQKEVLKDEVRLPRSASGNEPKEKSNLKDDGHIKNVSRPSPWPQNRLPRFRDWNPDVRVARETGLSLVYDSGKNTIVIPELGLSSREAREARIRITPQGISRPISDSYVSSGESHMPSNPPTAAVPNPTVTVTPPGIGASRPGGGNASNAGREKH